MGEDALPIATRKDTGHRCERGGRRWFRGPGRRSGKRLSITVSRSDPLDSQVPLAGLLRATDRDNRVHALELHFAVVVNCTTVPNAWRRCAGTSSVAFFARQSRSPAQVLG